MDYHQIVETLRRLSQRSFTELGVVPQVGAAMGSYFTELATAFDLMQIRLHQKFFEGQLPAYALIRQLTNQPMASFAINTKPSADQKKEVEDLMYSFKIHNAQLALFGVPPIGLDHTHSNHEEPKVWTIVTRVDPNNWYRLSQVATSHIEDIVTMPQEGLDLHVLIWHWRKLMDEHGVEFIAKPDKSGPDAIRHFVAARFQAMSFPQIPNPINGRTFEGDSALTYPLPDVLGGGLVEFAVRYYDGWTDLYDPNKFTVKLLGHKANHEFLLWDHVWRVVLPKTLGRFMVHVDQLIVKPETEDVADADTRDAE